MVVVSIFLVPTTLFHEWYFHWSWL